METRRVPRNGRTVVSLFSGCGGSDLGFHQLGFETIFASEFVEAARHTYALNFPGVPIDPRDVRELKDEEVRWLRDRDVDVVVGSPPCASYSMAARGAKGLEGGWNRVKDYGRGKKQRTDDLFPEFIRLVRAIRPKAFVAENVHGLVRGKAKGWFVEFLIGMKDAGYRVKACLLDAKYLGVPQTRLRLIFVGFREDLGIDPDFPDPLPYVYTVGEALDGFPEFPPEHRSGNEDDCLIADYAIEAEAAKLGPGEKSKKFFNLRRLDAGAPSYTVVASGGHPGAAAILHPCGWRKPTIQELQRICGFPDDFVLTGTYEQQWERLGRAVPPPMMAAVARVVDAKLAASAATSR